MDIDRSDWVIRVIVYIMFLVLDNAVCYAAASGAYASIHVCAMLASQ